MTDCTPDECEKLYTSVDKWKVSLLAGFIFMLLSSPCLYKLLDGLLSPLAINVAVVNGCPTGMGLLITTILFVVVTRALMN